MSKIPTEGETNPFTGEEENKSSTEGIELIGGPLKKPNKSMISPTQQLSNCSMGNEDSLFLDNLDDDGLSLKEDEIPILIFELNENALNCIYNENYDKAMILLKKCQKILDILHITNSKKDRNLVLVTAHNLALCCQKLGLLELCSTNLKICIDTDKLIFPPSTSVSCKLKKLRYLCKIHMQLCAILSQQNNHVEAIDHAKASVKYGHIILRELAHLCESYAEKLEKSRKGNKSIFPESKESTGGLGLCISLLEMSSQKILPILKELLRRLVPESPGTRSGSTAGASGKYTSSSSHVGSTGSVSTYSTVSSSRAKTSYQIQPPKIDMRTIFGYLNNSDWIFNLNIGNIMQLSPLPLQELLSQMDKELELTREAILDKVSLLAVSYFCVSTEKRFLYQEKGVLKGPMDKGRESEFWHAKSLEIACCFLPTDCPLVNHILLSYQKHHSPVQAPIPEDMEATDNIDIIRPLDGKPITNFQPIIRSITNYACCLSPITQELNLNFFRTTTSGDSRLKRKKRVSSIEKEQMLAKIYNANNSSFLKSQNEDFELFHSNSAENLEKVIHGVGQVAPHKKKNTGTTGKEKRSSNTGTVTPGLGQGIFTTSQTTGVGLQPGMMSESFEMRRPKSSQCMRRGHHKSLDRPKRGGEDLLNQSDIGPTNTNPQPKHRGKQLFTSNHDSLIMSNQNSLLGELLPGGIGSATSGTPPPAHFPHSHFSLPQRRGKGGSQTVGGTQTVSRSHTSSVSPHNIPSVGQGAGVGVFKRRMGGGVKGGVGVGRPPFAQALGGKMRAKDKILRSIGNDMGNRCVVISGKEGGGGGGKKYAGGLGGSGGLGQGGQGARFEPMPPRDKEIRDFCWNVLKEHKQFLQGMPLRRPKHTGGKRAIERVVENIDQLRKEDLFINRDPTNNIILRHKEATGSHPHSVPLDLDD